MTSNDNHLSRIKVNNIIFEHGIKQVRYKGWIQNFKVFKSNTYVYNTTKWNKKKLFNKYLENKDPPNDQMSE